MFYVNKMSPYEEAQHILEVLQRGNPLKGISTDGGIIQVEQEDMKGLQAVLDELTQRGYKVTSIEPLSPSGWAVGIKLSREKEHTSKSNNPVDLDKESSEELDR